MVHANPLTASFRFTNEFRRRQRPLLFWRGDSAQWKVALLILGVLTATVCVMEYVPMHQEQRESLLFDKILRTHDEDERCRFYLAESSIPEGGLGVFTAVEIKKGEETQSGPDICIYITNTPIGTALDTHTWSSGIVANGAFEGERRVRVACEGFAGMFNTMPMGLRTSEIVPIRVKSNAGLDRAHHPGAGAISEYFGVTSIAERDVEAGSELTTNYFNWRFSSSDRQSTTKPMKTPEFLKANGWCIDNIDIRQSKNLEMGRGAFAKRRIREGSVVAPAPLQFFQNRSVFQSQDGPETLLVNYCFQVPGTDILLFPYGPGVNLINHNNRKPNVDLRWSKRSPSHYSWLDLPLDDFWKVSTNPGAIILEYIALRDVNEGEELFLDYGEDWETAWKAHVASWKPPPEAESYGYPLDIDVSKPIRTVHEQAVKPYPSNLITVCNTPRWTREPGEVIQWSEPTSPWPQSVTYCHVLKREEREGQYFYEVALDWKPHVYRPGSRKDSLYIDVGVPQNAIHFVERMFASDMHLPHGFRHPMSLPETLIPVGLRSKAAPQ